MIKRIITILLGGAITAFGIASLVNSGLGCFGITAAYIGLSNLFGVPLTVISLVIEGLMLVYVCYKGEGVGLSSILACSYVSLLIDIFKLILPHHSLMVIFGICTMLGWAITASADLGEGPTNILTTTLVKSTGKSVAYIRTIIDAIYFIVALLTARHHITIVSIVLLFVTGKLTEIFYKLFKYDPVNVKHDYIVQLKNRKYE